VARVEVMLAALGLLLQPYTLAVMLAASVFGLFVGAMPGLTATMATALLVPITFFMAPVPAIAAIVAASAMAIFAGDIPGALLRIPGTPASAAYTDEAYAMTRKGEAEMALGAGVTCSVFGGLFGAAALMFLAPPLAELALKFSSYEYFWLSLLGLACAILVSPGSPVKGAISLLLGLLIATIGIDPMTGFGRFTLGYVQLLGGLSLIPVLVGMYAVAEILRYAIVIDAPVVLTQQKIGNIFAGQLPMMWKYRVGIMRGNIVGTLIGALPGAGADIAAWISYALAKRFSKTPEKFGTGHVEGIAEAGAANNSALGGAYVPATVFGIPGDSITAIVIGVLYMKGMNPGPTIFIKSPELIYAVFLSFILANLMMLPLGWAAIKVSKQVLSVPRQVLMPIILMFCLVGSFAIDNTVFAVTVMLLMGIIGFLMEENGIPIAPAVLGLVLGPLIEQNFITSMMKADGRLLPFFERPIAGVLGVITILIWLAPLGLYLWRRTRAVSVNGR
jgi:putative tricarboxylic transport membrane protein